MRKSWTTFALLDVFPNVVWKQQTLQSYPNTTYWYCNTFACIVFYAFSTTCKSQNCIVSFPQSPFLGWQAIVKKAFAALVQHHRRASARQLALLQVLRHVWIGGTWVDGSRLGRSVAMISFYHIISYYMTYVIFICYIRFGIHLYDVCLPACLAGWLAGWLAVCLSVSLSVCLSVLYVPYVETSACLSLSIYIYIIPVNVVKSNT